MTIKRVLFCAALGFVTGFVAHFIIKLMEL
jgi:hypothetical protein